MIGRPGALALQLHRRSLNALTGFAGCALGSAKHPLQEFASLMTSEDFGPVRLPLFRLSDLGQCNLIYFLLKRTARPLLRAVVVLAGMETIQAAAAAD